MSESKVGAWRIPDGREFQRICATMLCSQRYVSWCEGGQAVPCHWTEDSRRECAGQDVNELIGEKDEFVRDAEFHWYPVELDDSGGDVLPRLGVGENPGS